MTNCIFLGSGNLLNSQSVVEQTVTWEVFSYILLDKFDTKIRVIHTLDFVTNPRNCKKT